MGHIGIQCLAALTSTRIIVVDRNPAALALAEELGADTTVVADGNQLDQVLELTGGVGAEVFGDFVAEEGAELDGPRMLRRAGSYFVIGYGGTVNIPTIDIISTEINVVGNLVGTAARARRRHDGRDGDVRVHIRRARTVRVSIDANGEYCRQLLAERYGLAAS